MATKKPLDKLTTGNLPYLLANLEIAPDDWDILLIGDGSGNSWDRAMGFSCVLIDRVGRYRTRIFGGVNTGTSQLAELLPYIFALAWYRSGPGKARKEAREQARQKLQVHILSDNMNMVNQGNKVAHRKAWREFWAVYEMYEEQGYQFTWHHEGRLKVGLNRVADLLAGTARVAVENAKLGDGTLAKDLSLYDINPEAAPEVTPTPSEPVVESEAVR